MTKIKKLKKAGQSQGLKSGEIVWWAVLIAVFLIGMAATVNGYLLRGITSTNLSNPVPWGIWVVFYIYFIGVSVGAFLLGSMVYVFGVEKLERLGRTALMTALVSLMIGLIFITLDIGRPDHFLNTLLYWNVTSMMAWEIRCFVIYFVALALAVYFSMRGDIVNLACREDRRGRKFYALLSFGKKSWSADDSAKSRKYCKIFTAVGIPFVVLVSTGALFAVLESQPFMNHSIMPLIFLISELVCGTAVVLLICILQEKREKGSILPGTVRTVGKLLSLFICIELVMVWYELLVGIYNMEPAEWEAWRSVLAGPSWWVFWVFQMGLALIFPLILLNLKKTRTSRGWLFLSCLMIAVGVVGVRYNMVVPSFLVPRLPGMAPGTYMPSLSEWLTCAGLTALGMLLYSLGEKLLPVAVEDQTVVEGKGQVE